MLHAQPTVVRYASDIHSLLHDIKCKPSNQQTRLRLASYATLRAISLDLLHNHADFGFSTLASMIAAIEGPTATSSMRAAFESVLPDAEDEPQQHADALKR